MNEAASGAREVSENIDGIKQAVGQAGQSSSIVLDSVQDLLKQTETLNSEVDNFVSDIRMG